MLVGALVALGFTGRGPLSGVVAPPAAAARLLPATISLDGKVVLRGSSSDDGHPDADEVWTGLRGMRFKPAEDWAATGLDADAEGLSEAVLGDDPPKPGRGRVLLDMSYGGTAELRRLRVVRREDPQHGRHWVVDPMVIRYAFASRQISRREAAELRNQALPK
jgi:hypothetical protein